MQARQLYLVALFTAALAVFASATYFGLLGLPKPSAGVNANGVGFTAAMAILCNLIAVHRLADRLHIKFPEMLRTLLEIAVTGLAFLFVLYHLTKLFPYAGPVATTIDAIIPAPILHWASLAPGLIGLLLTQVIWRSRGRGPVG
ncbi:hypothetical protein GALL_383060 [mine drainage metagenome]|uniref:Uncharacterized protein n=1 Tax=mine drainage metagenome TaxID=410659 RepID=A0A1J5QJ21_9ZZZZ